MNTDQTNDKPIVLRCNEDGLWEKYEPYMTIDCPTEEDYNFIVRAIEHYKQREWISVEERLPNKSGQYLTWHGFYYGLHEYSVEKQGWNITYCEDRSTEIKTVTHWMPLPEPPKGD